MHEKTTTKKPQQKTLPLIQAKVLDIGAPKRPPFSIEMQVRMRLSDLATGLDLTLT
jgi:hypothetical protein